MKLAFNEMSWEREQKVKEILKCGDCAFCRECEFPCRQVEVEEC